MLAAAAPELISPVLTVDYQNRPDKRVESSFMGEQLNIESEDFKYAAEVTGIFHDAVMGKKRYFVSANYTTVIKRQPKQLTH